MDNYIAELDGYIKAIKNTVKLEQLEIDELNSQIAFIEKKMEIHMIQFTSHVEQLQLAEERRQDEND